MAASLAKAQLKPWPIRIGYSLLGVLIGLGHAPFNLPFLLVLAVPFLAYWVAKCQTSKAGFAVGWWAGLGYFAATLNWIVEPFLVDIQTFGWMAPFALVLMSGGMAMFWAVPFWATVRFGPAGRGGFILLACLWTLSEFARATILTGFPWGLISYVWVDTPVAQLASILGPHGLGFATLLVLMLPVIFAPNVWRGAAITLVILAAAWGLGALRLAKPTALHPDGTIVRLIQPNAEQHLKWDREMRWTFFQRQLGYTGANTLPPPHVIIWPESSMPFFLGEDAEALQMVADAAGDNAEVIAGVLRREDGRAFNSLIHLDQRGGTVSVFDKHHLVPFGEYLPFHNLLSKIGLRMLTDVFDGGFSAGDGPRVIDSVALPAYQPLICYEAIFPRYSADTGTRPDWLVHITNDAWFGSFSGPFQHLAQTQMRAIEQGLPLARAANTGVTAMIDPYGQVIASLGLGRSNFVDVALPAPLPSTIYAKTGEFFWLAVVLGLTLLLLLPPNTLVKRRAPNKN